MVNWQIILGLGEWAGAIAVFATLFYLVRQVRLNTVQIEKQIGVDLDTLVYSAYDPIYDGNNAEVMTKGLKMSGTLNEAEAYVFNMLMYRQVYAINAVGARALAGELPEEVIEIYSKHYFEVLVSSPGGKKWLQDHLHVFGKEAFEALNLYEHFSDGT